MNKCQILSLFSSPIYILWSKHIAVQYFFVIWSLKYSPAFSSQTHDFVDFQVLGQSVCELRCQMDV